MPRGAAILTKLCCSVLSTCQNVWDLPTVCTYTSILWSSRHSRHSRLTLTCRDSTDFYRQHSSHIPFHWKILWWWYILDQQWECYLRKQHAASVSPSAWVGPSTLLIPKPEPYQNDDRRRWTRMRLPSVLAVEARPVDRKEHEIFYREQGRREKS